MESKTNFRLFLLVATKPLKLNSDLFFQKLEHRTQKAITQLIRNNSIVKSIRNIIEVNNLGQRLESGNPELLNAAINQAMASDFK